MRQRAIKTVDVFGKQPYLGKSLAVVLDGEGLSDKEMGHFARWMNLSETTFLLPPSNPEADYRVRIFTPVRELPFGGHPALGSCHAWLEAGGKPKASVQECGAELVTIRRSQNRLVFAAPKLVRTGPVEEETLARIGQALGLPRDEIVEHQWVDNGPGWVAVLLRSAQQVLALEPDYVPISGLELGVVEPYPEGSECQFEVRAFITRGTRPYEDPVIGSLNGSLAQWLIGAELAPERHLASQGTILGCAGRVYLECDPAGQVWMGGAAVTCVESRLGL